MKPLTRAEILRMTQPGLWFPDVGLIQPWMMDGMPGIPAQVRGIFSMPGTADFQIPGSYTFITPIYSTSFTLQVWGGSGGGAGYTWLGSAPGPYTGSPGTFSRVVGGVVNMTAQPGQGGSPGARPSTFGDQGAGGAPSGGNQINQAGGGGALDTRSGASNAFGWCLGGTGSLSTTSPTTAGVFGGGGGAGAYVQSSYNFAQLPNNVSLTVVVGQLGAAGASTDYGPSLVAGATNGNSGRVLLTWS